LKKRGNFRIFISKYYMPREVFMAYKVDTEKCANCGSCDSECPVEAISEKDSYRWIDPVKCQGCGACAGVCPTDAISEE
jgi:ferredoxin